MPTWIIQMVINYVLTQLANFGTTINWAQVAADAATEVLALVDKYLPSFVQAFVNPGVQALVSAVVDAVALAMADSTDLGLIVGDLQAKDWKKALSDLEAMVLKVVHPQQASVVAALAQLKAAA